MDFKLSKNEEQFLLKTAREIITAKLEKRTLNLETPAGILLTNCGAFVTLHQKDKLGNRNLRGCIGNIIARQSLFNTIKNMAQAAAFEDPRFSPMNRDDWPACDIEISVLSPLEEINDPGVIKVGVHGIFITRGFRSGVLLPQVATEQGWDLETFITHTCYKAGLPADAWKDSSTKIEIFSAQIFSEN